MMSAPWVGASATRRGERRVRRALLPTTRDGGRNRHRGEKISSRANEASPGQIRRSPSYPQFLLANLWISLKANRQAIDRNDFFFVDTWDAQQSDKRRQCLSTREVGKLVDIGLTARRSA
ncbi:hypothetical protein [Burkholderia gladioli]|uniref:hypothetical protein n=1 Tax=Burkholderia gladioli TaxID=28095 RepID=UPI001916EB11|nr:hypothetical protein [Burkholderia gladioli]